MSANETEAQICKILCQRCGQITRHQIKARVIKDIIDDDEQFRGDNVGTDEYQIIECMGCENISFRQLIEMEPYYPDNGIHENIYPPRKRAIESGIESKYLWDMPSSIKNIYDEILKALDNNMFILAGIGLRMMVEAICDEGPYDPERHHMFADIYREENESKTGIKTPKRPKKLLSERIGELKASGHLSQDGEDILHSIRIIGNDAAHEFKRYTENTLYLALDVLEGMIKSMYIYPKRAKKELPPRPIEKKQKQGDNEVTG